MPASEHPEITRTRELVAESQRCWARWKQVQREAALLGQEAARLIAESRRRQAAAQFRGNGWMPTSPEAPPAPPTASMTSAPTSASPADSRPPAAPPVPAASPALPAPEKSPAWPASSLPVAPIPAPVGPETTALLAATAALTAATAAASEMIVSLLAVAASDSGPAPLSVTATLGLLPSPSAGDGGDYLLLLSQARAALQAASGAPAAGGPSAG